MEKISNVPSQIIHVMNEHKARTAILAAVTTIATVGLLLAMLNPNAGAILSSFTSSMEGRAILAATGMLTLGTLAWVFKPVISNNSDKSDLKFTLLGRDEDKGNEVDLSKSVPVENKGKKEVEESVDPQDSVEAVHVLSDSFTTSTLSREEVKSRYFQTVETLSDPRAQIGDYTIADSVLGYKKLTIKFMGDKPNTLLVRESSQYPGRHRILLNYDSGNKKVLESVFTFTLPQISAMMRAVTEQPEGFRLSSYNKPIFAFFGLVVLTKIDSSKHFVFNSAGALQEFNEKDFEKYIYALIKLGLIPGQ